MTVLVVGSTVLLFWWYDKQWAESFTRRQIDLDRRLQLDFIDMERTVWQERIARMEA